MQTKSDILKNNLLEALEQSLGIVTTACKKGGCARSTFYEYYNKDEAIKSKVAELPPFHLDFVESQLHKQIKDGNTTATIFYLKTKGKKRVFVERQEIQMDGSIESKIIEWTPAKDK